MSVTNGRAAGVNAFIGREMGHERSVLPRGSFPGNALVVDPARGCIPVRNMMTEKHFDDK
jgi:hypothetical protein